ncbi:unnamed protein product [Adineta steineri]|uniref:EGF-like domain-containing protein n=1 Tax=Adineta steineri TaxID=433720 RepID=A0A814QG17_9BILA|nr:unnamed protein product [Adineta steineri]
MLESRPVGVLESNATTASTYRTTTISQATSTPELSTTPEPGTISQSTISTILTAYTTVAAPQALTISQPTIKSTATTDETVIVPGAPTTPELVISSYSTTTSSTTISQTVSSHQTLTIPQPVIISQSTDKPIVTTDQSLEMSQDSASTQSTTTTHSTISSDAETDHMVITKNATSTIPLVESSTKDMPASTEQNDEVSLTTTPTITADVSMGELHPLDYFVAPKCADGNNTGEFCNISMKPCDSKPCYNRGNCTNDPSLLHGYSCTCMPGFIGTDCEQDIRPCKSNTCLHEGTCVELNNTHFVCNCTRERIGVHCEHIINYCDNVTCLNKGICRALHLAYKCECLFGTSEDHCQHLATSILVRQYIARGVAYIAIIVISVTFGFVLVLDVLKYIFGIDITQKEREEILRKRTLSAPKTPPTRKSQKLVRVRV